MHILESYASTARAKISKPHLIPKFFPMSCEKYITLQGDAKFNSRKYSWFSEVVLLLKPYLEPLNIKIVQIGSKDDNRIPYCDIDLCGQTSYRQNYDVIRNSLLHVGPDSLNIHIASVFGTKILGIYSNMYSSQSGPFWTKKQDSILIQAPLLGNKPSYSADENPCVINLIKPEAIAQSALDLLNINETITCKSVYFGENYTHLYVESVPDSLVNSQFYSEVPLHIHYDWVKSGEMTDSILYKQISLRKSVIITDKPLNMDILDKLRSNVLQIIIKIKGTEQKEIVQAVEKAGFIYILVTELNEQELNNIKLDYINFRPIIKEKEFLKEKIDPSNKINEDSYFKSTKFILSNNKVYASKIHWLNDISMSNISEKQKIGIFHNDKIFWDEIEFFYLFNE